MVSTSEGDAPAEDSGVSTDTLEGIEKNRNHPLYLHPSDTPCSVLTSVQLTGTENYSLWSRSLMINLRAKSKLGFVLGSCRKSDYKPELEEQWEKCNAFVLAWIMNTVSKELLSGIVYASDAAMVWADLNERFNKVDGSRSYHLHRDICTLHQGNLTVSGYTKLRLLWDEFDALVPPPTCNCDKSRVYVDHLQFLRLFAFLMGLNEMYSHARSQILMMNPLPNVNKAYAMITSDESQRMPAGTRIGRDVHESMALYAEKRNDSVMQSNKGKNVCSSYDPMAMYTGQGNYSNTGNGSNYKQKKNWHLVCDYCKWHGHTKDIRFRLIGYPADWKFKKKFGPGPDVPNTGKANHTYVNSQGKDEFESVQGPNNNSGNLEQATNQFTTQPTFTPNQYNKILQMINKEDSLEFMANTAGPLKWKGEGDW
ncbi:hypothetical protein AABB24_011098 [Solanum stoloniferum]|uniref:Retrotransposon Copia-like N-terminal domain-containing protein n=1 Tax=Solanum stoloniferum TaxID=62892 RepID=A0ABD2UDC8_9SOLN